MSFLANKPFSAFFPKAVNGYNKALSLLCVTSSTCSQKRSQHSPSHQSVAGMVFPTHQAWGWQLRGPALTPAHQPVPKTRYRGQRASCGVLLPYPFSKLLPHKEALVRGKPKQHFWPFELYVTAHNEQTIRNLCWEKPVLSKGLPQGGSLAFLCSLRCCASSAVLWCALGAKGKKEKPISHSVGIFNETSVTSSSVKLWGYPTGHEQQMEKLEIQVISVPYLNNSMSSIGLILCTGRNFLSIPNPVNDIQSY